MAREPWIVRAGSYFLLAFCLMGILIELSNLPHLRITTSDLFGMGLLGAAALALIVYLVFGKKAS